MVAIEGAEELQLIDAVRFCALPSLKVPIAVNAWVVPTAIAGFGGFTCTDTRPGTTIRLAEPVSSLKAAVMVAFPMATAVACPLPLRVATGRFEELQVAEVVRSWVVPSL
jgi:hypothetical protein